MQKIGSSTSTADANGEFTEGSAAGGVKATQLKAAWLNSIQRELVGLLTEASLAPKADDDTQLRAAVKAIAKAVANAYGIGGAAVDGSKLNLNDATLGTITRFEGSQTDAFALNYPTVTSTGAVQVAFETLTYGMAGRIVQETTEVFGAGGVGRGRTLFRVKHDATWYPWREVSYLDQLAKVATGGRFADLATEIYHWMAGKSAANGWKNVYLQNQEPTGHVSLEMANSGGYTVLSYQGVQDGAGGWAARFYYTPPGDATKDRRQGWLGISTDGVVQLGGASLPAGRTGQILTSEGDQVANGVKRFNGEVQTSNPNGWRHVGSSYGSFWRNDGTALYLLLTAKDDPYGTWSALRPFAVSLSNGRVAMSAGLETLTVVSGDRSNNAASTRWVGNEIGERAGAIDYFAMSTAPTGYLKANGAAVSRTTYAVLFAAIGTAFGAGDGSTTFNLPDLRGEFVRGWDDGRGVDSGRALGSFQASQNLSHAHAASMTSAGAHNHTMTWNNDGAQLGASDNAVFGDENRYGTSTMATNTAGAHTHTTTIAADGGSEARPRNVALLACIKY